MITYIKYSPEWEDRFMEVLRVYHKESTGYGELETDELWVKIHLEQSCDSIIMATDGEVLVGFIWIGQIVHWFSPERGACDLVLYILPSHRNGLISRRLIKEAEALSKANGCAYFQLSAAFHEDRDNRTMKFYRRLGYTPRGSTVYKPLRN